MGQVTHVSYSVDIPFPVKICRICTYFQSHGSSCPLRHQRLFESWWSCSPLTGTDKSLTRARHFPSVLTLFLKECRLLGVAGGLLYELRINNATCVIVTLILSDSWADTMVEKEKKAFLLIGSPRKHFRRRNTNAAYMCKLGKSANQ